MELIVHEDAEGPPGYGWIEFDRAGETEDAVIGRPTSDNPWLGPEGAWQSVRHVFKLAGGVTPSRRRGLRLVPEIVDFIAPDTQVTVELPARGVVLGGWWPHLAPSGRARTPGILIVGGAVERVAKAVPPPEEPVVAKPEPRPTETLKETPPPPPRRRRSSVGRVFLLLLLLAALGLGGAWYFDLPPFGPADTCGEDCDVTQLTVEQLRERLRRMVERGASAQELYDFGKPLYGLADAERREIGYRAIDAAAQRGHPEALYELGRIFDPRDTLPGQRVGVESPDAQLAARYYKAAADGNAPGARDALNGLCEDLRRAQPAPDSLEAKALSESCGT